MIIYKVTNKLNGKIYIGQTCRSLNERMNSHYKLSRMGSNTNFHRALSKYNASDFNWEILCDCDTKQQLNYLERKFINQFNSFKMGYNMTEGGDGGDTISMKSDKSNQGAKKGNIPWNKGKNMKELGYVFTNKKSRNKFTQKQKDEHSKLIKESKRFKDGIQKRTPAKQVIIEDDLGNVWNKQKDFIEYLNISYHKVRDGLKNDVWEYGGRHYKVVKRK